MAAGLPVVASDFDGYRDTVDDEVGRRVPTRLGVDWSMVSELGPLLYERPLHLLLGQSIEVDLPALTSTLATLAADASLRERLGKAARLRAERRYAWPVVVKQLEATWRHLSAQPFSPRAQPHPLRLDFGRAFGHFMTGPIEPTRHVQRTPFSRAPGPTWVIYPELRIVLDDDDVRAALDRCEAPVPFSELVAFLHGRLGAREPWVAGFIATWLLKHGLLEDAVGRRP
jgi:hypothetical protein